MRDRVTPIGRDFAQRRKDKAALAKFGVRDGQGRRCPDAAAPTDNVEIERTIAPTLAGAATRFSLDFLELGEEGGGPELAFDEGNCIGITALRRADGCAFDNA